ncbi:MAG: YihA family ribosome biogenesis GTP-binding protein [Bacteroidales bacterium]|nr:YihA family ribosome biogenesis GTP-binding protein [Bacteroidales bacterium]
MIIKDAHFISSNSKIDKLPKDNLPEYAFIGRSNVGKSSLINALVQRKGLAKTSATPGKTIAINHFVVNNQWYLVDLPGYGYAKRSKKAREEWQVMLANYIKRRRNLIYTFVLVDSRIEPQNSDIGFMEWLGENQVPFCIVFTKADKVSKTELDKNIETYKQRLLEDWEELPPIFVTSSETKLGRDEVLDFIEQQNVELENYLKTKGL